MIVRRYNVHRGVISGGCFFGVRGFKQAILKFGIKLDVHYSAFCIFRIDNGRRLH